MKGRKNYPFDCGRVADGEAVEEVHEDDDDQEDEGQQKEIAEDCANMTILKDWKRKTPK